MQESSLRHPRLTVAVLLAVLFILFDFVAAFFFVDGVPVAPSIHFHHALKPNVSSETLWGAARYPISTNNLGLKDSAPREVPKAGDRRRLLFLGDSFTEGVGFPYQETFVGIVGARVRQAKEPWEVLNGGVISHSPYLYFLHLKDLVERQGVKIDEVAVFIDVSDIQDELVYESFVPEMLTANLLARHIKEYALQNSLVGHVLLTRLPQLRPLADKVRFWLRSDARMESVPATPPSSAKEEAVPLPVPAAVLAALSRPAQSVWDHPNYYVQRDTWIDNDAAFAAWGAYGLQLAHKNLKRLVDFAAGKGIKITFAIYPWPRFVGETAGRGPEVWRKIAAEEGWTLVDLYEDFAQAPDAKATLFIPGDVHWNARGHRFVAERWMSRYCAQARAAWCGSGN